MTEEILGYSHDFCNTAVIEKSKPEIPFVAHNFFGFDIFYFFKSFKLLNSTNTRKSFIVAEDKGIIPHEILVDMDSLLLTPDQKFRRKTVNF